MSSIKLPFKRIVDPTFQTVFRVLCNDPGVSVKDAYALAQSIRQINDFQTVYNRKNDDLVKQLGQPMKDWIPVELERLREQSKLAIGARLTELQVTIAQLEAKLPQVTDENYIIPEGTPELAKFTEAMEQETNGELSLFLDHKIRLRKTSKLTPAQMAELLELLDEPAE